MKWLWALGRRLAGLAEVVLVWADALVPKRRQILFSSGNGRMYADNARYLFEYMARHTRERLVWWFHDPRLVAWARQRGVQAVFARSLAGLWTALRSGVWVMDHGPILPAWHPRRRVTVQLWHGVGPKREPARTAPIRVVRKQREFFSKYDLFTTTSYEVAPEWGTRIPLKPGALVLDGYPRHDAILRDDRERARERIARVLGRPGLPARILLYAPTWREQGAEAEPDWTRLEELVEKSDTLVLLRTHPLYSRWQPSRLDRRFVRFNGDVAPDIYEYLAGVDVLVTDYSSLCVDFLVLRRPIVFYVPDLEEYDRVRGIHWRYPDDFPGDVAASMDELVPVLEHVLTRGRLTEAGARRQAVLYDRYFALPPGRACERLTARIEELMDRRWPRHDQRSTQ
ncbi:CDP-glycerol glycerophosphotransferase family protein [Thermaerobacter composti]|uniref:CDP-glycerol glycerophosphotransferase family protein n=1 Tax=Thermaerobacter composti TaxID=554949 RepID=A0ABZ0QSF7_9FIRM|nr:CDP-glycerol glycerophosphotransferase family protein [Thermaerobacter composti]WPD19674.1 CDP-glycerol glycerophosphotransferase family protein [Thermaerobacter composti]